VKPSVTSLILEPQFQ